MHRTSPGHAAQPIAIPLLLDAGALVVPIDDAMTDEAFTAAVAAIDAFMAEVRASALRDAAASELHAALAKTEGVQP